MKLKLAVLLGIAILCIFGAAAIAQEPDYVPLTTLPESWRPDCVYYEEYYEGWYQGYGVIFQEITLDYVVLKACKPHDDGYTVQLGVGPNLWWCHHWQSQVITYTSFTTMTIPFEWDDSWRPPEMGDVVCMQWTARDLEPPIPPELPLHFSGSSRWWFHYRTYLPVIDKEGKK